MKVEQKEEVEEKEEVVEEKEEVVEEKEEVVEEKEEVVEEKEEVVEEKEVVVEEKEVVEEEKEEVVEEKEVVVEEKEVVVEEKEEVKMMEEQSKEIDVEKHFSNSNYQHINNNNCDNSNYVRREKKDNSRNYNENLQSTCNEKVIADEEDTVEEWQKESENYPFIGKCESLDKLEKEYANSENFFLKISNLKKSCKGMRHVKKDGCCFYRALLFGIFEYFLRKKSEIKNFMLLIKDLKAKVQEAGYTYSTIDEFYQEFMESLSKVMLENSTLSTIEEIFNDPIISNYLVVFSRLLVSSHMKLNKDMYLPYITNYTSIDTFCTKEVDPMYVEAEHLQVNALTKALNFPVEIIYLDNTKQALPVCHRFPEGSSPLLHLLYRPGHYDIVYVE